jgi:LacI family transcriptional regulator
MLMPEPVKKPDKRPNRRSTSAITITDVARESGFSAMTVSRVVNNDRRVRTDTRNAILEAIEKLGYAPNQAARMLAGSGPIRIGLPFSNPSAAYMSEFFMGALDQAQIGHCQLVVVKCELGEHEDEVVRALLASGIDGLLLPPPLSDSVAIMNVIAESSIPAVAVAGGSAQDSISTVQIDDFAASRTMTQHLLDLGHRRIGFVSGDANQATSTRRLAGYRAALTDSGLPFAPELVVEGTFTYRSGLSAANALFALASPPSAIFASNDDMAAAAVAAAHQRHLEVPGDVTVCGFDDTMFARSIWPELTTIHQPIAAMARAAVAKLSAEVGASRRGEAREPEQTVLDYLFIQRDSDGAPAS